MLNPEKDRANSGMSAEEIPKLEREMESLERDFNRLGGTRTRTELPPEDFKSSASAVPPRAGATTLSERKLECQRKVDSVRPDIYKRGGARQGNENRDGGKFIVARNSRDRRIPHPGRRDNECSGIRREAGRKSEGPTENVTGLASRHQPPYHRRMRTFYSRGIFL